MDTRMLETLKVMDGVEVTDDGRIYILFASTLYKSNPQAGPFDNCPRKIEETGQVYFSEESMRYHMRRMFEAFRRKNVFELNFAEKEEGFTRSIRKHTVSGEPADFKTLVKEFKEEYGNVVSDLSSPDILCQFSLDAPLFGIVYAEKNDKKGKKKDGEVYSAHRTGVVCRLGDHATIHKAHIIGASVNNAMCQLDKEGKPKKASGSHTRMIVDYGFLVSLWEIYVEDLLAAFVENKVLKEEVKKDKRKVVRELVGLIVSSMWNAYAAGKISSRSQSKQASMYIGAWQGNHLPLTVEQLPQEWFYHRAGAPEDQEEVTLSRDAKSIRKRFVADLPLYLEKTRLNKQTKLIEHRNPYLFDD